jgi:hypothetical protein
MRVYFILMIAAELALCFAVSCSDAPPPSNPEITGPFKTVEFPEPWVKQKDGALVGVNDAVQYVVRRSKDSKLLFAVKQGFDGSLFGKEVSDFPVTSPDYDYYSDTRFAVSVDGPSEVKKVTEDEWNAGEKVLHSYHFINTSDSQVSPEGVNYNGRLYRKSGESWGNWAALVSPRKTRIAIFSYTSREKISESIIPGLKNTEPGSGEVFLDIYDLSSGDKVGGARSPYGKKPNGFAPSMIFAASVWIDDSYIVMPLDPDLSRSLIGMFPGK